MTRVRVTRGFGLLEKRLARERARIANKLVPPRLRSGRLLDIGCGVLPFFLVHTDFNEKYGLDLAVEKVEGNPAINVIQYDLHKETILPFSDDYFDVVTMLAVFEHIEPERLSGVLLEIRRVLRPGGLYILTTPAKWTDTILRIMARLRLVSPAEIDDHKAAYDHRKIISILMKANFKEENITCGHFEMFANLWTAALKEGPVQ